jgi:hypothetical protein
LCVRHQIRRMIVVVVIIIRAAAVVAAAAAAIQPLCGFLEKDTSSCK